MKAKTRRVRHDVADSLMLMGFSLGASVAVASVFALATRVAW
ncbi:MAG: hypothetical protein ABIR57_02925 [Aeromicrobium sp.]